MPNEASRRPSSYQALLYSRTAEQRIYARTAFLVTLADGASSELRLLSVRHCSSTRQLQVRFRHS